MKNDLIDKYVYAVISKLPKPMRSDVKKELKSNIMDMLPSKYNTKDIKKVLIEMGNPIVLASRYNATDKYLISPKMYDRYIKILKLVLLIVTVALIIGLPINEITNYDNSDFNLFLFILEIFGSVLSAGGLAFAAVTIVFAVLDHQLQVDPDDWSFEDLDDVPDEELKEDSRFDGIFPIIFTSLFTIIMVFFPNLLAWYEKADGNLQVKHPLFNIDTLSNYYPLFIISAISIIVVSVMQIVYKKHNLIIAVTNAISNVIVIITSYIIITSDKIFNSDFIAVFNNNSSYLWERVSLALLVLIIICSLIDTVWNFFKL